MSKERYRWPYENKIGQRLDLSCDVLVLGGGLAGCNAAIAAARGGQRVILMEKGTEWCVLLLRSLSLPYLKQAIR